jgi:DNA-binding IclR family transcriptional regulator
MSRYQPRHEERHADPRAPHGQRVMAALSTARDQTMTLQQLRLVTGLDTAQVLRVLDPMVSAGTVRPLGDLRYQITQEAE